MRSRPSMVVAELVSHGVEVELVPDGSPAETMDAPHEVDRSLVRQSVRGSSAESMVVRRN